MQARVGQIPEFHQKTTMLARLHFTWFALMLSLVENHVDVSHAAQSRA